MNDIEKEKQLLDKFKEELDRQQSILSLEKETLDGEKKVLEEQKRLFEQQKKSFDMQKSILETGFKKLAADREMFLAEKKRLISEINSMEFQHTEDLKMQKNHFPGFFGGVSNFLSLKKRYKDLMKLYHPDNKNGDEFTVTLINREYEVLKEKFETQ
ncbi:MAG TPA: hypothetical protein DCG85_03835 [Lachnospiraceae bacterium]|nr:hypothetical protein [Lachnospiraceae bacterium]